MVLLLKVCGVIGDLIEMNEEADALDDVVVTIEEGSVVVVYSVSLAVPDDEDPVSVELKEEGTFEDFVEDVVLVESLDVVNDIRSSPDIDDFE